MGQQGVADAAEDILLAIINLLDFRINLVIPHYANGRTAALLPTDQATKPGSAIYLYR